MMHYRFMENGQEIGSISIFGNRVVTATAETFGLVVGSPRYMLEEVFQGLPPEVTVEESDDSASMHHQALFGMRGQR